MKIVIDTNVLISGLLRPFSSSGEIVRMAASGNLRLCYDVRILSEYKDVLLRPKFSFDPDDVQDLLSQIETCGYAVAAAALTGRLPDADDEPFLEAAITGKAEYLVTGNSKHYPVSNRKGITVLSPTEFLNKMRK